ncbi:MAG TPA: peptidylprolyl isomerase, partial [Polyangiaceae bacterium]
PYLTDAPVRKFAKADQVLDATKDYIAVVDTDVGRIVLDLYEADTPITVNSFVFLALNHFYEGILFHRVIDGFMAQTGDPNSLQPNTKTWGTGGPGYKFGLELNPNLNFDAPGVLGMANAGPTQNGSQFFITFAAYPSLYTGADGGLDQQYTVWGKVIDGLDVLPNIVRGEPPVNPSKIVEVRIGTKPK